MLDSSFGASAGQGRVEGHGLMRTSSRQMERLCEFCSNSTEVEDMCGKLHVEKIGDRKVIAAHHRCMQYSAGLVQYKFDHFGGFKISKVEEEVKRGRRLDMKFQKCAICKNMKDKKRRHGSATAGCAVASCRKTFHFYCAKKDPVAITKRMIIKYRKENKEVVMYRVFCCKEHENSFRTNKSALQQCRRQDADESDVSDDDSDDSSKEREESENEEQEEGPDGEDDFTLLSQSDSQSVNQMFPVPNHRSSELEFQLPDGMLQNGSSSNISNDERMETNISIENKENQEPEADCTDIMINSICSDAEENSNDKFDEDLVLHASQNQVSEVSDVDTEKKPQNETFNGDEIAESCKESTGKSAANKSCKESTKDSSANKSFIARSGESVANKSCKESTVENTANESCKVSTVENTANESCKESTLESISSKTHEKLLSTSTPFRNNNSVVRSFEIDVSSDDCMTPSKKGTPKKLLKLKPRSAKASKSVGPESSTITITADINTTRAEPVVTQEKATRKNPYKDCALILVPCKNFTTEEKELFRSAACQELNVEQAAFWCEQGNDSEITDKDMIYLIENLAELARKNEFEKLREVLLRGAALKEVMEKVTMISEYLKVVDEETLSKVHQSVQNDLQDTLNIKTEDGIARVLIDSENTTLYIRLGSDIDPQEEIRSRYFPYTEVELFKWIHGSCLDSTCLCTDDEGKLIVKWLQLETSGKFTLSEKPEGNIFCLDDMNNACLHHLRNSCVESSGENECSRVAEVLWVASMNSDLVKVWPFIKNCLETFSTTHKNFYAVINVGHYTDFKVSLSDIESIGIKSSKISAFTFKDPSANPASVIVVKVTDIRSLSTPSLSEHGQRNGHEEMDEIVSDPIQTQGRKRRSTRNLEQSSPKKSKK